MGTKYGTTKWKNPAESNMIKIKSSGWCMKSLSAMVGRGCEYSFSSNIKNGWIIIDFGETIRIKPTHYTLRHYTFNSRFIKNWDLLY